MSHSALPSQPQHRKKLLDLSSGKAVNTGEGLINSEEVSAPLSTTVGQDEAAQLETSRNGSLHVSPIGESWEVESDAATLGQTDSKAEAVELAETLAEQMGADTVTVHTSDGAVEKEISLPRRTGNEA